MNEIINMILTQYVVKIIIKKYRDTSSFLMTIYSLAWVVPKFIKPVLYGRAFSPRFLQ